MLYSKRQKYSGVIKTKSRIVEGKVLFAVWMYLTDGEFVEVIIPPPTFYKLWEGDAISFMARRNRITKNFVDVEVI
jgi:hypothetical protein